MIDVSPVSVHALRAAALPAYTERLCASLAKTYPHMLPRFPKPVQLRIADTMLSHAFGWGLTRQNALFGWCALMLTVAANFDREPEIRRALETAPEPRDRSVVTLTDLVSADAWTRAELHASNLPFFVPLRMDRAPTPDRLAVALGIVLYDQTQSNDPMPLVAAATVEAQALGLAGSEDEVLVIAAVQAFEGPGWSGSAWARELRRERLEPRAFVEALRLRVALEHGRFV